MSDTSTYRGDDLCVWPNDTACDAWDLEEMLLWMSDDYERIPFDTPRWHSERERLGYNF